MFFWENNAKKIVFIYFIRCFYGDTLLKKLDLLMAKESWNKKEFIDKICKTQLRALHINRLQIPK